MQDLNEPITRPITDLHVVYPTELSRYGRPLGRIDEERLLAYITEAEHMYVKKVLGEDLFVRILQDRNDDPKLRVLMEGGTYRALSDNCHCGSKDSIKTFAGLRAAMSYFVSAQNVMSGDFQSTRYGMRIKSDDYSTALSAKERSDVYNNLLEIGNFYLKECVDYCKAVGLIQYNGVAATVGSVRIRRIG